MSRRLGWALASVLGLAALGGVPNPLQAAPSDTPSLVRSAQAGQLRALGRYLGHTRQHAVAVLPNGDVLFYGANVADPSQLAQPERHSRLDHEQRQPALWRPDGASWTRLQPSPACAGTAMLPVASLLPGGQVLLSGGTCDAAQASQEARPQLALSLWDGAGRRWLPAPSLREPRVWHSATLLPDGSVLIAGGLPDPRWPAAARADDAPVASAERVRGQTVDALPPLPVPVGLHAALADADGGVVLIGGVRGGREPTSAVQRWTDAEGWQSLPSLRVPRSRHAALALPDGRWLVAGGEGAAGQALASAEWWDPVTRRWRDAPALPTPVRESALTRLKDGSVLLVGGRLAADGGRVGVGAWLLDAQLGRWQPAGLWRGEFASAAGAPPVLQALDDDRVRIFAGGVPLLWERGAGVLDNLQQEVHWDDAPAVARLRSGEVLVLGTDAAAQPPVTRAWMFEPASRRWRSAGRLTETGAGGVVELPSGRLLHLAQDANGNGRAECATAPLDAATVWQPCGRIDVAFKPRGGVAGFGLLPDGRAGWVANMGELMVYDEAAQQFRRLSITQQFDKFGFGAPRLATQPIAYATDLGRPVDASVLFARNWETHRGHRPYDVVSNGQVVDHEDGLPGPRMHWDAAGKRWTYVLRAAQMGRAGEMLPDGCVLSVDPPSLFQPEGSRYRQLPDVIPGLAHRRLIVLDAGRVMVLGEPLEGAGPGFAIRHADCSGLLPQGDDALLMTDRVDTQPGFEFPAPVADVPAEAAPVARRPLLPDAARRMLWVVAGLVLSAIVLAVWRRRRPRPVRPASGLRRELGWRVKLPLRLLAYGALALFAIPTLWSLVKLRQMGDEESCQSHPATCLRADDRGRSRLPPVPRLAALPDATPVELPCRFIGRWATVQKNVAWTMTLDDAGRFRLDPPATGAAAYSGMAGYWMVQSGHVVWRYPDGVSMEPDVNRILHEDDNGFELQEGDGRITRFDRIERHASQRCDADRR
ncbi:MAG: hypothetical protein EKK53_09000 [Burkholderiales bacterium]|nr:MAG: hypothetical protein EKK53_09000 [Burkholderiales bacterium]